MVSRFARQKKLAPRETYGHIFARKVSELAGDDVALDATEEGLVALKRCKIISGQRLVDLLGRHHSELRS